MTFNSQEADLSANADALARNLKNSAPDGEIAPPRITDRRRIARGALLQAVYQARNRNQSAEAALTETLKTQSVAPKMESKIKDIARYIDANQAQIEQKIAALIKRKKLDDIALVDLCVFNIALAELAVAADVNAAIIVNEAVELARVYGGDNSAGFINGALRALSPAREIAR